MDFHPLQKPGSAIQVCVHQFSAPWLLSSPLLFFCLYFVWRPSQTCLWIIIWTNYTSSSLEFWDIFGMLIFIWDTSHFHAIQFCLAPFSDLPLVYRLSKFEWQGHLLYEPPKKSMKAKFILVWPPKRLWKPSLSWFGHQKGYESQVYLSLFDSSSKMQMGYLFSQPLIPQKTLGGFSYEWRWRTRYFLLCANLQGHLFFKPPK